MNEIEILGANRLEPFTRTREASRAVVVRDGLILLSHETVTGWVLVPGGGLFIKKSELARLGLRRQRYRVLNIWDTTGGVRDGND